VFRASRLPVDGLDLWTSLKILSAGSYTERSWRCLVWYQRNTCTTWLGLEVIPVYIPDIYEPQNQYWTGYQFLPGIKNYKNNQCPVPVWYKNMIKCQQQYQLVSKYVDTRLTLEITLCKAYHYQCTIYRVSALRVQGQSFVNLLISGHWREKDSKSIKYGTGTFRETIQPSPLISRLFTVVPSSTDSFFTRKGAFDSKVDYHFERHTGSTSQGVERRKLAL
jgi:hypothetical protein